MESALADGLNSEKKKEGERERDGGRGVGEGWFQIEDKKENGMRYTALKTSNKINVVSGDSIRKTHRTISHTILRQNRQDSYLLHGRPFPPPYNRLPSYPRLVDRSLFFPRFPEPLAFFILNPRESAATRSSRSDIFPTKILSLEQIVARLITREGRLAGEET